MKDSLKHINPHSLQYAEAPRSVLLLGLQAMESMSKELSEMKSRGAAVLEERKDILGAGMAHSDYVQADSTGSKGNRVSLYTQILCSPLFTAYFSNQTKPRLQVLQSLCGLTELAELPNALMDEYWKFYRRLLAYKDLDKAAQNLQKPVLDAEFDRIFTRKTGCEALDKLLARTYSKKTALLPVLSHPNLPLHNNAAELAARRKVRKRDVCFHTVSAEGTRV